MGGDTSIERRQVTRLHLGAGLIVLVLSFLPSGSTGVDRTGSMWEMFAAGNIGIPAVALVFVLLCVTWPLHHALALGVGYALLAVLLMALILIGSLIGGEPFGVGAWLTEVVMATYLVRSIRGTR
jgi:hypothetical protein